MFPAAPSRQSHIFQESAGRLSHGDVNHERLSPVNPKLQDWNRQLSSSSFEYDEEWNQSAQGLMPESQATASKFCEPPSQPFYALLRQIKLELLPPASPQVTGSGAVVDEGSFGTCEAEVTASRSNNMVLNRDRGVKPTCNSGSASCATPVTFFPSRRFIRLVEEHCSYYRYGPDFTDTLWPQLTLNSSTTKENISGTEMSRNTSSTGTTADVGSRAFLMPPTQRAVMRTVDALNDVHTRFIRMSNEIARFGWAHVTGTRGGSNISHCTSMATNHRYTAFTYSSTTSSTDKQKCASGPNQNKFSSRLPFGRPFVGYYFVCRNHPEWRSFMAMFYLETDSPSEEDRQDGTERRSNVSGTGDEAQMHRRRKKRKRSESSERQQRTSARPAVVIVSENERFRRYIAEALMEVGVFTEWIDGAAMPRMASPEVDAPANQPSTLGNVSGRDTQTQSLKGLLPMHLTPSGVVTAVFDVLLNLPAECPRDISLLVSNDRHGAPSAPAEGHTYAAPAGTATALNGISLLTVHTTILSPHPFRHAEWKPVTPRPLQPLPPPLVWTSSSTAPPKRRECPSWAIGDMAGAASDGTLILPHALQSLLWLLTQEFFVPRFSMTFKVCSFPVHETSAKGAGGRGGQSLHAEGLFKSVNAPVPTSSAFAGDRPGDGSASQAYKLSCLLLLGPSRLSEQWLQTDKATSSLDEAIFAPLRLEGCINALSTASFDERFCGGYGYKLRNGIFKQLE